MSLIIGADGVVSPHKKSDMRGFGALQPVENQLIQVLKSGSYPQDSEVRKLFETMDNDGNGCISKVELTEWVVRERVFPNLDAKDCRLTAERLFSDIDTNNSNTLDLQELSDFLRLIQREARFIKHASKHHLTTLPASVVVASERAYSIKNIEKQLHTKIDALVSRDNDRYRQILTLFKQQAQRAHGDHSADQDKVKIYRRDFATFLSLLGLFATRGQADQLFVKYDKNGDGVLTPHEFLTRAKAPDYPGIDMTQQVDFREGRGKKQFNETAAIGIPARITTPAPSIIDQGAEATYSRIRSRIEQKARTGTANSDPMARRKLFASFERYDPERTGLVTSDKFSEALALVLGVVLSNHHLKALQRKYSNNEGMINYPQVVMAVYPKSIPANNALFKSRAKTGSRLPSRQAPNPKSNPVINYGSYWLPKLNSRASSSMNTSRYY